MSTTIDSRVVEMQFDNKNFESNVATTMSTLDKFKQKLNLTGATKGLEDVDTAARRLDMSSLGTAVETVQTKFSALGVMGVTALANITNSAVNAGKRMISALTIDPITTGFSEYETKINSIQTIMANTASKGTTMDDVTRVIGELNTYADKTIYNFAEMTRNIGTFTAAGIGLEESATAIQGIANLAAVSGSNSQQASTAMYQLSQAMASGTVKLMDWNSVVNAGMGGQVFQDALKDTARAHGVAVDDIIKKNGSFRESLQEGWITTEILTETLQKMTKGGAAEYLSNLTGVELKQIEAAQKLVEENKDGKASYEALAEQLASTGKISKDEAMNILKMADNAENAATKVKTFTQLWDTLKESAQSGWSQTWEILVGDFEEAKETLTQISDVIGKMISASADARNELLQGWKDAGGRAHLVESLFNIIKAFTSLVAPIKEAFSEIFPPLTVKQLLSFTEGLKNLTSKLILGEETAGKLKRTFKGIFAVFDIVRQAVGALFKAISPLFGSVGDLGGGILDVTADMGDWLVKLNESIKASGFFTTAVEKIHAAIDKVKKFLEPVIEGFKKFSNEVGTNLTAVADNAEQRLGPLSALGNFIKGIFEALGKALGKVMPFVLSAATAIGNVLGDLMNQISDSIQNADYDSFFDLTSGGIIAAIGVFIAKFIKSGGDLLDNAGGFLDGIKDILGGVSDALGAFQESLKADALKKIAIAIAILAASLLVLSLIPSDKLTTALVAITTLFGELLGSMAVFSKIAGNGLNGVAKLTGAMIGLSVALLILSAALKILSTISWDELGVAIVAMVAGLAALIGAVYLLPKDAAIRSAGIVGLAIAMVILGAALKIMATLTWEELAISLIALAGSLLVIAGAMNLMQAALPGAAAMLLIAPALVILGAALKILGSMSWGELAVGLVALAGSLLIIAVAATAMVAAIPGALAMLIIAPALVVLAAALKIMGSMSWGELAVGLVALAGSLVIIAVAATAMIAALPGAAAMLVMAAALAILAPVLLVLGSMSLAEIGKSLLVLAGVFVILGVAGYALAPVIPVILGLAGAMALIGLAAVGVGVGILAVGVGVTMLAAALAASGGAITVFISSLISMIPFLIEQIGLGLIKLCEVIAGSAAAICDAVAVIVVALVDALVAAVPSLVNGALVLINSLLESLVTYLPSIVGTLVDLFVALVGSLIEHVPTIVGALASFWIAVFEALAANIEPLLEPLVNLFTAVFQGIADLIGPIINQVIKPLIDSISPILYGLAAVIQAVAVVIGVALQGLAVVFSVIFNGIATVISSVGQAIGTILQGIATVIMSVAAAISATLHGLASVFSAIFNGIATVVSSVGQAIGTILQGISDVIGSVAEAITAHLEGLEGIFDTVFNGISDVITSVGDSIKTILEGIADVIESVGNAALNAGTGFENLANGVKTITQLNFGDMVASLGAVATAVGDIGRHSGELKSAASGMEKLASCIMTVPTALQMFVTSFTSAVALMQTAGQSLLGGVVEGINSQKQKLVTAAKDAILQFADGIKSKQDTVKSACTKIVSTCATAISNKSGSFKSAGKDLGAGLVQGINAKKTAVYNAAYALGQAAVQGEKDGQKSNSPSKLTILAGKWLGEGLIIGMEKISGDVYDSGYALGKSVTDSMTATISKVADLVNTDIDSQPTIRPVLDLTDVKSGIGTMDNMLLGRRSLQLATSSAGAISASMTGYQNGGSDDIVSAIEKLGKNLGNTGDTYTISGITYDDGTNISNAVKSLVRAARIERRV